jgi:hypothetical protein
MRKKHEIEAPLDPEVGPRIDMERVEEEVGPLPTSIREALLAFCDGQPMRAIAREAFACTTARDEVEALLARLDAMSFDPA